MITLISYLGHAQIQDFLSGGGGGGGGVGGGGGGVQVRWPENRLDNIFGFFFSPQLTLQFTEGFQ